MALKGLSVEDDKIVDALLQRVDVSLRSTRTPLRFRRRRSDERTFPRRRCSGVNRMVADSRENASLAVVVENVRDVANRFRARGRRRGPELRWLRLHMRYTQRGIFERIQ